MAVRGNPQQEGEFQSLVQSLATVAAQQLEVEEVKSQQEMAEEEAAAPNKQRLRGKASPGAALADSEDPYI